MSNPHYVMNVIDYNKNETRTKNYSTKKAKYRILNQTQTQTKERGPWKKENLYRSVILCENEENPRILSFSPPSSVDKSSFLDCNLEKSGHSWENIYVNEAIEGTMIQLFYDWRIFSWEIATKSAVGGHYWVFRDPYDNTVQKHTTLREMFLEALGEDRYQPFHEVNILKELSKDFVYTFVLQHPENPILFTVTFAKVFLVAVYKIEKTRVEFILPREFQEWKCFHGVASLIHFPRKIEAASFDELEKTHGCHFLNDSMQYMGFMMLLETTGERVFVKNQAYEDLKRVRGNYPNLQYQYLSFYRIGKISEYLKCFPMHKKMFYHFKREYLRWIKQIHECYCAVYIRKEMDYEKNRISKKYLIHIWRLHHQIYIPSLRRYYESEERDPTKIKKITVNEVKKYLDGLEPRLQLYYLHL